MTKIIIIIVTIVVVAGGIVWATTHKQDAPVLPDDRLTFSAVQSQVDNGAKLYDVRTADEYKSGHFADATNFDLAKMQAGTLPDVAKDTTIYVYCRSGNRSAQATTLLKNAGYTYVTNLGGLSDVEAMGGTLTTE